MVDTKDYVLPLITWANNSSGVSPKKGTHPTRNSYKIIPIDHQSTGLPKKLNMELLGVMKKIIST